MGFDELSWNFIAAPVAWPFMAVDAGCNYILGYGMLWNRQWHWLEHVSWRCHATSHSIHMGLPLSYGSALLVLQSHGGQPYSNLNHTPRTMALTAVPLVFFKRPGHNYLYLGRTTLGVQRCGPWYLCLYHLPERRFHTLDNRLDCISFRRQLTGGWIPRCCGSANTSVWDVYIDG